MFTKEKLAKLEPKLKYSNFNAQGNLHCPIAWEEYLLDLPLLSELTGYTLYKSMTAYKPYDENMYKRCGIYKFWNEYARRIKIALTTVSHS